LVKMASSVGLGFEFWQSVIPLSTPNGVLGRKWKKAWLGLSGFPCRELSSFVWLDILLFGWQAWYMVKMVLGVGLEPSSGLVWSGLVWSGLVW
jgi:hypothetical protein